MKIRRIRYICFWITERKGESIADPWYTGDFEVTYKDIMEGLEGLLKYLKY